LPSSRIRAVRSGHGGAFAVKDCGNRSGLLSPDFVCASLYPLFDRRTFSGLAAVLLALPWIDYLPDAWPSLLLAVMLNAIAIYAILAALSLASALLRSLRK
jgi:hypothetical protein